MWDKCQGNGLDADVPTAEPVFLSTSVVLIWTGILAV